MHGFAQVTFQPAHVGGGSVGGDGSSILIGSTLPSVLVAAVGGHSLDSIQEEEAGEGDPMRRAT